MGVAGPAIAIAANVAGSAITGYKIGSAIGETVAEHIRDKSLNLVNKHRHRIWAVLMYKSNKYEDWLIKGWFEIIPLDTFSYSFAGIKCRTVYYFAICEECGSTWGNGDATGYVPTTNDAFTHYDSDCIGKVRDFSKAYLGDEDVTRNLTGY